MKKFGLTLMALVVFLVLAIALPFAMAKEKPAKYLKIGCNYGLTGALAPIFIASKRSLEIEADRINKKAGIMVGKERYHIKLLFEDNGYTSEGSVAVATKLIDRENVKFMFNIGAPSMAQTTVTEPSKVLSFLSSSTDKVLSNRQYSIRVHPISQINTMAIMEHISKNIPEVKRVCLIYKNDPAGVLNSEYLPKLCAHYGMEFIGYELFPPAMTDFYPLLAKMLTKNPDMIVSDVGTAGALMVKQAVEKGYKGYFMVNASGGDILFGLVGNKVPDGRLLGPVVDMRSKATPKEIREMTKRYEEKYGKGDPLDIACLVYNHLTLIIQAVQKAGTVDDTDKIRDVIMKNTWNLPWSKTTFVGKEVWGVDGQGLMPVFVSSWTGSKKEIKLLKVTPGEDIYPTFSKIFVKK